MEAGKKQRVNKNKKKSWRKHIDINDVEDYLDDKRLQERTGGLVAEKPDEALFFVDSKKAVEKVLPVKRKRKEIGKLRCWKNLEPDPNIKPVNSGKNVRKNFEKRLSTKEKVAREKGIVSKKQLLVERNRKLSQRLRDRALKEKTKELCATYDLWESEPVVTDPLHTEEHYMRVTKKMPIKYPLMRKKPSAIDAVEVAHPGASYNPSYEDHKELIDLAVQREIQKKKAEMKIIRATDAKMPSKANAPTAETWLKEMSGGLFNDEDDDEDMEHTPEELEKLSVNPPIRREDKKTKTERNKEKKQKLKEVEMQMLKEKKSKDNEFFRLKALKKEVSERERLIEERRLIKKAAQLQEPYKTKKLGKMKFEEPDLEVKMTQELEGSLRKLKPEGHLLIDRFKNLQKRNIIETRQKAKFDRRYKLKFQEKRKHREVTL
ncbi:ribosome biogenesis protein NOP53-like [Tubulanus polymorphus]|uniref:ribosome biogenesis protein NOP53-like n=1 Tax=Tubulanus polymorphus TaxID=672921 RepID=UPI003DA3BE9B